MNVIREETISECGLSSENCRGNSPLYVVPYLSVLVYVVLGHEDIIYPMSILCDVNPHL